jgi:ubiquinol-cytochrome c reductase cytochrome c subunit
VRRLLVVVVVAALGACLLPAAAHGQTAADPSAVARGETVMQVNQGRTLFVEGCASCHGQDAQGTDRAPDLHGVGAQSADFYLRTGRMPLAVPGEPPLTNEPLYSEDEILALVAYVGSLGGPPIPSVDPAAGNLSEGERLFTLFCAGCHGKLAKGGVVTGAIAPTLDEATTVQVAEAIRIGPFVMPPFDEELIDQEGLDSIVAYVEKTKDADNAGGWDLGGIGPIPEGMVAFFIGLLALLLVSRLIGERGE